MASQQQAAQPSEESFTIASFWGALPLETLQKAWELVDGTLGVNDKLDWLCGTQQAKFSRAQADDNKFVMRGSMHGEEDSAQLTLCAAGHSEIFSVTPTYGSGNSYFGSAPQEKA